MANLINMYKTLKINSANIEVVGVDSMYPTNGVLTASYMLVSSTTQSFQPLPFTLLQLNGDVNNPARFLLDTCNNTNAFGSSIRGRRIRGTFTSASSILTGDALLQVTADGWDGSQLSSNNVSLTLIASENWNSSSHGSHIVFRTTNIGHVSSSQALMINPDGTTQGSFSGSFNGTASCALSASYVPSQADFHVEKGIISGSQFSGAPLFFNIIFSNNFSDTIYNVSVIGEDARVWSISDRTTSSFSINTNSSQPLTGIVMWRVEE